MLGPIRAMRDQHKIMGPKVTLTEAGLGHPSSDLGVIFFVFIDNMDLIYFILLIYFYYLFIYVWLRWVFIAARGLSSCTVQALERTGSVVAEHRLSCNMWDLSSLTRESNLGPLHWESGVLTTGPPGKSLDLIFKNFSTK